MSKPVTATRTAPSSYVVNARTVQRGLRFTHNRTTFEVVGDPITGGWSAATVRVRQVTGWDAGNEFSAYLYARD